MAFNETGTYKTTDIVLGRGILYVADLNPTTGLPADGGWEDMGSVIEVNETITTEKFEHFNSRTGFKTKDISIISSREMGISFTCESQTAQNLARFQLGIASRAQTNAAVAGFTEHTAYNNVVLGRWYDVVSSTGARAYNINNTDLVVEKSGAPDVLLVEGTDYTVDEEMGRIFLLSTAVNIAAGDEMDMTLAAAAGAGTVDKVAGMMASSGFVALKFIGENPINSSKRQEVLYHKVQLTPSGDRALISDEAGTMAFEGTVQQSDAAAHVNDKFSLTTDITDA